MKNNAQMIYIGPSLSGARLIHATVFREGYPTYIKEMLNAHPWLKNLFVPVSSYADSMKQVHTQGTALYIFAKKCKEV